MRILFWSELFWPYMGGAEIFASKLLLALRQRGYEIVVVTRQDTPDLPLKDQYKGITVYRLPFWQALMERNLDRLIAVRRQMADLKHHFAPDLVHLHGFGPTSFFFHLETAHVRFGMGAFSAPA